MYEWFMTLPVWLIALLVGGFCCVCTSLGAASVFFCKKLNSKYISALLSFAGGIMIASSFFSLILPALEFCENVVWQEIVFVVCGFLAGVVFIVLTNILFDKKFAGCYNLGKKRKSVLVATSITLHNIPEGMAVGVAIGGALVAADASLLVAAVALGIGIGLQNIPEGASVALALRCEGKSRTKSFFAGVCSGVVEPIFACVASVITVYVLSVLPMFLAFSAGAMMIVAITELVPEALESHKLLAVSFLALGFAVMALLDIIL